MRVTTRAFSRAILASIFSLGFAACAHATSVNLVQNGSFETTNTANTSSQLNLNGFQVTNWTSPLASDGKPGYNFLFTSGTATAAGYYNPISLWNQSNGGVGTITASPDGGNFLAMDGAFEQSAVSQTLTGLTVGQTYNLSFYYAGAQQSGYTGATTEAFTVTFGNQTYTTPVLNDASHDFTGWYSQSVNFTATSTSQTLSFLAVGTPGGEPPFSLLDGVSLTAATPEPSSLALLGTGILSVGGMLRRRRATR